MGQAKKKSNRGMWIGVVVILALIAVAVMATSGGGGGKPAYRATVANVWATSPSKLSVEVSVRNTSHEPVTPSCTVQAVAPTGATATTAFTATHPVAPGTRAGYRLTTLTVTDTAAYRVSKREVKLTCS